MPVYVVGKGAAAAVIAFALLLALVAPAHAQQSGEAADLGQLYRQARTEAVAAERARRLVQPLPLVPVRTPYLDSLRALMAAGTRPQAEASPAPLPRIRERRAVRRLERPVFKQRFGDVQWAYLGANGRTVLDTMRTRELRARLQAHYGDPTRTVVDADSLAGRPIADYVQFEYWFVVNDAFPIKVVDTGGPFDRGLVFSAPARFRERLRELRAAFLAPLLQSPLHARYVDYYFDTSTETWYRAGFNGRRFFVRPVERSEVLPGQRPRLRRVP